MTETLTSHFEIRPASPLIGAEIDGVDLTKPVDDATAQALREAFWSHKVLVFRNQNLSPLQHVEAVRIFDEPFDHPLWVKRHPDSRLVYTFDFERGTADRWHIGGTWRNPPFSIESLTYQVVPEVGGHTLWADLQAAYDGLSRPVQERLAGARRLTELRRQLRLEAGRLRALGQPGHLALRGQRLRRATGVPEGHRRLAS